MVAGKSCAQQASLLQGKSGGRCSARLEQVIL